MKLSSTPNTQRGSPEPGKLGLDELQQFWNQLHENCQKGLLSPLAAVGSPGSPALVNRLGDRELRLSLDAAWAPAGSLRGLRVLDIGCGIGRWVNRFQTAGARAVGLDWSFAAVQGVHQRLQTPTTQMSVEHLGFTDESFDAINCVTVLQHLPPQIQRRALEEIRRILKPGGWFCLLEACTRDVSAPHMFPRTREEWAATAQAAGFEVVACEKSYFGLILRIYIRLRHRIRVRVAPAAGSHAATAVWQRPHLLSLLQTPLVTALALVCYSLGRMLRLVRLTEPLHCAFLLRRPSSTSGKVPAAESSRRIE